MTGEDIVSIHKKYNCIFVQTAKYGEHSKRYNCSVLKLMLKYN